MYITCNPVSLSCLVRRYAVCVASIAKSLDKSSRTLSCLAGQFVLFVKGTCTGIAVCGVRTYLGQSPTPSTTTPKDRRKMTLHDTLYPHILPFIASYSYFIVESQDSKRNIQEERKNTPLKDKPVKVKIEKRDNKDIGASTAAYPKAHTYLRCLP